LLAAYRRGLFPMRVQRKGPLGWWSPDPRAVIPLDGLYVSRSLRKSCRRFEVRVDTSFRLVMEECAEPSRPAGWIDEEFVAAYTRLYELGWAHSVEVWTKADKSTLVGGVYGVAIGGLFAGESMFHRQRDASKVALVALVDRLNAGGGTLFDVQWLTPHLASLGAVEIERSEYLERVTAAVAQPQLDLGGFGLAVG
jgi:leucyl/phenylalanyl-tRNA--protein transferase